MVTQHIPAWKRLGLKLKYANETSPATDSSPSSGNGKKRPLENGHSINHKLKKSRIEHETSQDQLNTEENSASISTPEAADAKRKKSVTFASDTKLEDGETAQTIQFWVPGSPGSTPKRQTSDSNTAKPAEPSDPPIRRKKVKKPKDQKTTSSPVKAAGKGTAALDYLNQFYHHKSSWKFNKNHEVWLLKHALSTNHIPIEHNLALASYIHGLKSAGAKQRLIEQSRDAIRSIDVSSQEESNTRAKVLQAVDSSHDQNITDEEQKLWFESQDRGLLLLFSLNENIRQSGKSMQSNGQALPRVKKNKSRTSRVEVESSSSSESESESESESGSEDEHGDEDGIDTKTSSQKGFTSTKSSGTLGQTSDETSSEGTSDSSAQSSSEEGESSSTSSDSE